ncbi:MAG: aminobenzoyl-glutamate utilization protein A [bacterium]|jgi:aminobenzoyl-glutamate utilization protein A
MQNSQKLPCLNPDTAEPLRHAAAAQQQKLIAQRRAFHALPELGWQEVQTTAAIVKDLVEAGYEVVSGPAFLGEVVRLGMSADPIAGEGDTGCIALYDTGRPGPTVCMRVDIDALPISEAGGNHAPAAQGFVSKNPGVMHSCGHDGHAAIGLATARVLEPYLKTGQGKLKLLFQPAEEGGRGGRAVAEAGWMDDVDLFFAIHLGLGVPSDSAAFAVHGVLANMRYDVFFKGRAAHAGKTPEGGRSALLAACQAVLGLHMMAQSSQPGIRVNVGLLEAGTAVNIVPEEARFTFEMRAQETEDLDALKTRCCAFIEATAQAHGVECTFSQGGGASGHSNPTAISDWAAGINATTGAFANVVPDFFFGASEDAGTLAHQVTKRGGIAGIFVLGADLADDHHTPNFDFEEGALVKSVLLCSGLIAAALELQLDQA